MSTKKQISESVETPTDATTLTIVKGGETTAKKEDIALNAMFEKFKPKPLTAEERIIRIAQFEAIAKRFNLLKQKNEDLRMWDAGNDRTNASIFLRNSSGFEFSVSNSHVIKKVRDIMQQELDILLYETENEVQTFEI
jgi:hypothetical protein